MAGVYYNEIDLNAAAWLRELIRCEQLPAGEIDTRDIRDVRPDDLRNFHQCHFFTGIGGWPLALSAAGWPLDRPVWSGSCPCQPFSEAGSKAGFADERHLWPYWYYLIEQCGPHTVFGEQVASKGGLSWLDLVSSDMENAGYAVGAVDTCAAGFGSPNIRQRLYFVADGMGNSIGARLERHAGHGAHTSRRSPSCRSTSEASSVGGMADSDRIGRKQRLGPAAPTRQGSAADTDGSVDVFRPAGPVNGFWGNADWLLCRYGKWRAVEPGTFPLAHGLPARVGRLRGYGNAINVAQATAFISAYIEVRHVSHGVHRYGHSQAEDFI